MPEETVSHLSLKGSSKTVSDFFEYSLHSLLYQRGIYPPEDFQQIRKYGLMMMYSVDDEVKEYIKQIMKQLHKWVYRGKITRLVVPIIDKSDDEVVERWEFQLDVNKDDESEHSEAYPSIELQKQIQAIFRQITASVTFLPALDDGSYTFTVLVYTDIDSTIPSQWIDTNGDGKEILVSQEGQQKEVIEFRSFSTDHHKVGTSVSYKINQ